MSSTSPGAFVRVSSEMRFYPGAQRAIDDVRSGALDTIGSVRSGRRNEQLRAARLARVAAPRLASASVQAVLQNLEVFDVVDTPVVGKEQGWRRVEPGSQSVSPTVTAPIFEAGFSDASLRVWAAFLAERAARAGRPVRLRDLGGGARPPPDNPPPPTRAARASHRNARNVAR